jgi:hypothetical protein
LSGDRNPRFDKHLGFPIQGLSEVKEARQSLQIVVSLYPTAMYEAQEPDGSFSARAKTLIRGNICAVVEIVGASYRPVASYIVVNTRLTTAIWFLQTSYSLLLHRHEQASSSAQMASTIRPYVEILRLIREKPI